MSLERVIAVAEGEVGNTELPPGSNRVKYWDIFGSEWQGQPWCVAFLAWVFRNADEGAAFLGGGQTASCGTLLRWYEAMGQTVATDDVQPGDIVILNFHGTKDTDHCGLVVETPVQNGKRVIYTIEGNTSKSGSQSNGGMVCEKIRYPRQIVGVARPKYKEEEPMPKDDITGHWAEDAIRRCMKWKIITGFPDGTFRPNEPVTRAEAATMIDRLVQLLIGEDDLK